MSWPPLCLQKICRLKTPLASFLGSYGLVGAERGSLDSPPIRIQHPAWLAQWPSPGQQPMKIRLAPVLAQRPGRGQRPMRIRRFQDSGLEPAGRPWVPQWSILRPSCAHSIPDCRPIKMPPWNGGGGGYLNLPSTASRRITTPAFVETPSLELASPHLPYSDLGETPSLNRPLGN